MTRRPAPAARSEGGAVLVIALVFLVAIGLVLTALVSLTGTNLTTTSNLQSQRSREYAADAAVDGAIQASRTPSGSTGTCPKPLAAPVVVGTVLMDVQCTSTVPPGAKGRIVEFDACSSGFSTFASCQAAAVVRAEVTYDDSTSTGGGENVWSWVVDPASS